VSHEGVPHPAGRKPTCRDRHWSVSGAVAEQDPEYVEAAPVSEARSHATATRTPTFQSATTYFAEVAKLLWPSLVDPPAFGRRVGREDRALAKGGTCSVGMPQDS